ncbi:hypothetical protein Taro_049458 [Colocasia esculenta]|uniref:BRX domain-containing protein n=1 Tax=Colocasia esculenta TaxID=4460 RepID=A0A843XB43_COLES|nr:hypothetical protein [Colocasia esculenta]
MLTCIACSKQLGDAGEDVEPAARGTPRTKEAVKSLTSQIKDMVLKFSGSYRQSKPCIAGASSSSSAAYRKGGGGGGAGLQCRSYGGMDAAWEVADAGAGQHQFMRSGGSTSSTPGWDFACVDAESADARFANGGRRWVPVVGLPGTEFDVVMEEDGEPKEWVAQVEPGVHITFLSLPGGGNDLKRIRFSREMFNKWQAQRWWGENYDRIMELYNVQRFSRQGLPTPPRSEDEREYYSSYSRVGSTRESPATTPPLPNGRPARGARRTAAANGLNGRSGGGGAFHPVPDPTEQILQYYHNFPMVAPPQPGGCWMGDAASADASMTTASSRDEAGSFSVSNASDQEATEWVEQDEPGVYITLRQLPDGTRELRRVRFSREHFAERHAKQWWELNRERIQAQYL